MNSKFRRILPDIICVLMFAVVSLAYFYPAVFDGRKLDQHDHGAAAGIGVEIEKYILNFIQNFKWPRIIKQSKKRIFLEN